MTNTIAPSAVSITTGTYYVNNRETGKFINRNATSSYVGTTSGLIEDIGESIEWQITKLPDGYYTIQSTQHPEKFLTALTVSATMSTHSGEITDAQKWQITETSEQYYIRALNGDFLYATSGETASYPLGLQSGNLDPECKWRLCEKNKYDEYPKNADSENVYIGLGYTQQIEPNLDKSGTWTDLDDFLFVITEGNGCTISNSGIVVASEEGISTLQITHKVTGHIQECFIIVQAPPKTYACNVGCSKYLDSIDCFGHDVFNDALWYSSDSSIVSVMA